MKIKHNIVIYDDDLVFLEQLHEQVCNILSKHYYNCEISMFNNSNDFIKYCSENAVDIILTEIDMTQKDEFGMIEEIRENKPDAEIVFVNAYEELAYQSFRYNPFQFVSKADLDRLDEVLNTLMKKVIKRKKQNEIVNLTIEKNIVHIDINKVMYLRSESNYIAAYDESEKLCLRFRGVLNKVYNELIDFGFIRTHRCYIVNCRFIKRMERKKLILMNGKEIQNSRKNDVFNEAKILYGKFMRGKR